MVETEALAKAQVEALPLPKKSTAQKTSKSSTPPSKETSKEAPRSGVVQRATLLSQTVQT